MTGYQLLVRYVQRPEVVPPHLAAGCSPKDRLQHFDFQAPLSSESEPLPLSPQPGCNTSMIQELLLWPGPCLEKACVSTEVPRFLTFRLQHYIAVACSGCTQSSPGASHASNLGYVLSNSHTSSKPLSFRPGQCRPRSESYAA